LMTLRIGLLCALVAACPPAHAQTVRINEVMAANGTSVPEMVDFGDYPDWIELVNTGSAAMDLGGYSLSDDALVPTKWTFPSGSALEAGGFFLVWADGYDKFAGTEGTRAWWPGDTRFTTRWNHTNFKLSRAQEGVYLFDAAGVLVDSVTFVDQEPDVSLGRLPDGSWGSFASPTPLAANATAPLTDRSGGAAVTILPPAGRYASAVSATLAQAGTVGAIRYTLDGSRPGPDSQEYTNPIPLLATGTVRARVFREGARPGPVATATYLVDTAHDLPLVSLTTEPSLLWDPDAGIYLNSLKDREIPVSLEFFPDANRAFVLDAGARIGGENIFRFAQKPLNLYFRSEYGAAHLEHPVFDQLPFASWKRLYLRNGGDDWPTTMFRDGFQATLLDGYMSNDTQAYRPSVLYLNGAYWGLYNLREKLDERYFTLHHEVDPANLDHLESDGRVIWGDSTEFMAMLQFADAADLTLAANYDAVAAQIDVENLMDFVIAQSFLGNTSWGHNRETWRDRGGDDLWRWVLVDMDRGFNLPRLSDDMLTQIYDGFALFRALVQNDGFRDRFMARYAVHLNTTFRAERTRQLIDALAGAIDAEIPRHAGKWGPYMASLSIPAWGVEPGIQSYASWLSSVDNMRTFAGERPAIARGQVAALFGIAEHVDLVIETEPSGAGDVTALGLPLTDAGTWFGGVPLDLSASPRLGSAFSRWLERSDGGTVTLLPRGSTWRYLDAGVAPGASWAVPGFDDAAWAEGPAQLGYGDGDEATVVSFGADSQQKAITTYFRTAFEVADPALYAAITVGLVRDDGAAVYLNGTKVALSNLPEGELGPGTVANSVVGGGAESAFLEFDVDASLLVTGTNTLAVEVHQASGSSSDISFDLFVNASLLDPTITETVVGDAVSLRYTPTRDATLVAVFDTENVNRVPAVIAGSTVLLAAESPYVVDGSVRVTAGGTLTAEPGTVIRLTPGATIHVDGAVQLVGTETLPIRLEPYDLGTRWAGICLGPSDQESVFEFVHVLGAGQGEGPDCPAAVSVVGASLRISSTTFEDVGLPVYSRESTLVADRVVFRDVTAVGDYITVNGGVVEIRNSRFEGNSLVDMDAIDLGLLGPGSVIENNLIFGFSGTNSDGIDLGEGSRDLLIRGNQIHDIADKGVSIGGGSSALVERNVIARTLNGIAVKDSLSFVDVRHSTFVGNEVGVAVYEKNPGRGGASASVTGSVFTASGSSAIAADHLSSLDVTYSLSDVELPAGQGNLLGEARLVNPAGLNVHLQVHSPAIDAANPTSEVDPDGSRADMGATPYPGFQTGPVVINEINYHSATSADSEDWVELYNHSMQPVDLSGWILVDGSFTTAAALSGALSPGDHAVLARDASLFAAVFPSVDVLPEPLANGLDGAGDALYLYDSDGVLTDSVRYADVSPWPTRADGAGSTLELLSPELDNAAAGSWGASTGPGTPGAVNSAFGTAIEPSDALPREYALSPAYPNPFNPTTVIGYDLPTSARVTITIFDVLGRRLRGLVDGDTPAGSHSVSFEAASLPSGIYLAVMVVRPGEGGQRRFVQSLVLAR
jgi:hypothetical protein